MPRKKKITTPTTEEEINKTEKVNKTEDLKTNEDIKIKEDTNIKENTEIKEDIIKEVEVKVSDKKVKLYFPNKKNELIATAKGNIQIDEKGIAEVSEELMKFLLQFKAIEFKKVS